MARSVSVDLTRVSLRRAIDAAAASAKVFVGYHTLTIDGYTTTVTVHLKNVPLRVVLDSVLAGTNLRVVADGSTQLAIVRGSGSLQATGEIAGRVIDAATKRPCTQATVMLDDATRGVRTDAEGRFHIANVSSGEHRVTVRMLGYSRQTKQVRVEDGRAANVDVALEQSVNALDQVVVTGTVVATELKAVPNAITVITAKQIEERGITRIDQLFRGDVPGLFAVNGTNDELGGVLMFSRGATTLGNSAGTDYNTNPIKTYVDGIELANPAYLSRIDPQSIERIEILSGPQASTIYGSNALNGVMQIFTKRGTTNRPQLLLNLQSGLIQTNTSSAMTSQHVYDGTVTGLEGRFSYSASANWNHDGPWIPSNEIAAMGGSAGIHWSLPVSLGTLTSDGSFSQSQTKSSANGYPVRNDPYGVYRARSTSVEHHVRQLSGQTLGLRATYVPFTWWSHNLTLGRDRSDTEWSIDMPGYGRIKDTTVSMELMPLTRRSVSYSTTAQGNVTPWARVILTGGADSWQLLQSDINFSSMVLTGSPNLLYTSISRNPSHNTGAFFQGQLGLMDRLFLTYGLRAEWNPNFGSEAEPNLAPRYGIVYSHEAGPLTAKLRASYGRATRPPTVTQKLAGEFHGPGFNSWGGTDVMHDVFGTFYGLLANYHLEPERQQGTEGGIDLYFGNRGSLTITRYNQTVNNLIVAIAGADSIKSLMPNPDFDGMSCADLISLGYPSYCSSQDAEGYGYAWLSQNLNVANIRNQGWELQGMLATGPLTTRGTYSWTKSRSLGVTDKFQKQFASYLKDMPMYTPGASFQALPEHTWALGTTYASQRFTAGLNLNGIGQILSFDNLGAARSHLDYGVRLDNDLWRVNDPANRIGYAFATRSYMTADLTASYRIARAMEMRLDITNLTNQFQNDVFYGYPVKGRQSRIGFIIRN